MLHLIAQSPIDSAIFQRLGAGDDLLFLDKAVLNILQKGQLNETLTALLAQHQLYALANDVEIRGIIPEELLKGIIVIDYAGFVELSVQNSLIQTWS
jgi:tRNA 2-thiouridine synthesizing protein B